MRLLRLLRTATGRRILAGWLFLSLTLAGVVSMGGLANASTWTGRAAAYGYFDNKFGAANSPYPDGRGPVIDNNDYASMAIPLSVTTKQGVYNFLQNKYNNPGTYGHPAWDKTGVSFIVNTMLGNDPAQGQRNLSAAMWSDLNARLSSSNVSLTIENVSASAYGSVNTYYQYGNNDVAWYTDSTESGRALVFHQGGNVVYVLLYKCANPLGDLAGLPKANVWSISPSMGGSVSRSTGPTTPPLGSNEVIPGDTVKWTSTVKNNGPDATDKNVEWHYVKSNGWGGNGPGQTFSSGKGKSATASTTLSYTVQNGDLGKTLCVSTWAQPQAWNNGSPIQSSPLCYNVVYRYELHPSVTVSSPSVEAGASGISVSYSVANTGPTPSQPTNWQLTQCVYVPPATAPSSPAEISNNQTAQQYFGAGACNVIKQGTQTYTKGSTAPVTFTANTATAVAGTRFCYVLSVNPPGATESGWRHSALACIAVVKYPKVQVLGGDLLSGSVSTRGPVNLGGQYYGSWAQYGIFGMGGITGMASGGALAGGGASTMGAVLNALTFANTPSLGNFFSIDPTTNSYYQTYNAECTPGAQPVSGMIKNGTHEVICINGDLRISSDITYSGAYASIGDVPRVIYVVSGNILVDPNVQRIDPWLIAAKTLYTCDSHMSNAQQLTTGQCNKPLVFNGPVYVHDTLLGRTYGADDSTGKGIPAETFNLAPSNFLSSYSASVSASNIQTEYEKELPPRW